MTTYAYLEQALNADGVEAIQETNQELLDKATQLIDELVEKEHEFASTHLGQHIVEGALDETYENVQEPTSDVVIEAISTFADIISSVEYDDEEKVGLMECASALIESEDDPMTVLTEGFLPSVEVIQHRFLKFIKIGKFVLGGTAIATIFVKMQPVMHDAFGELSFGEHLSKGLGHMFSNLKDLISGREPSQLEKSISWFEQFFKESGISDSPIGFTFKSLTDTLKENSNLDRESIKVLAATIVGLVLLVALYLIIRLFKSGKKKQTVRVFVNTKNAISAIGG